jgi:hypothetical protein
MIELVPDRPSASETGIVPAEVEFLVTQEGDGGFAAAATCTSIFTQAETWNALQEMAREAVLCHYGDDANPVIRLRMDSVAADG